MAVYNKNGNAITTVYGKSGGSLNQAYDLQGFPMIIPPESNFTVMSYNVQWFSGLNANQEMQQAIIDTYNANIIGLQELGGSGSMPAVGSAVLSDYTHQYFGSQYNETAFASKIALQNVSSELFSSQGSESRGYQKAYFSFNGVNVCWINTHLETSSYESIKVAQAHEIYEAVQNEEHFIITGDFNTVCKSVSDTEYTTIMKQFVDAGYNVANCSEQFGFEDTWTSGSTASGTWYPCDHIITSANISMNSVIVDTSKIDVAAETGQSIDHLPIIAYLTI